MGLPAQVEQDIKDLEELEKQMTAPDAPADDGLGDSVEDTVTEPEPKAEDVKSDPEPEPQKAPATVEEPKPVEDFEQKYRSLQGKYDAEVPRLHQTVKELQAQLEELKQAQKPAEPEQPPEPKRYVTDEDKENFGEDLLDVQRRVAMEVGEHYQSKISMLEEHIKTLEAKLSETGGQIGAMSFEQKLRHAVPDFDAINADPRWVEWLNAYDPIIRGPRRNMAQQAFNQGDVDAVADYVKLFKASLEPQQAQQSDRQAELERQVTPKRTATATPPPAQQPGQKVYTEAQANRLWDKVRDLNIRGQFDEATKLEAEISAAYVEGRVRPR